MDSPRTSQTVLGQFKDIQPEQFEEQINRIWRAAERVKDTVIEQVATGDLPTYTGLSMVACITGQAFGYGLFHGQPAPADLIGDLSLGLSSTTRDRERELAGQH